MYELIPNELKLLPNWVNWNFVPDPDRPDHPRKLPLNPANLSAAKANDPSSWGTFAEAVTNVTQKRAQGVGFEFAPAPDGTHYFGVDIDNCEGDIDLWRMGDVDNIVGEFILALGSYAEYSVSGHGIHIICRGKLPEGGRRRAGVEMYDTGRFFIMTGNAASSFTELRDASAEIRTLHEKYIGGGKVPTVYRDIPIPERPADASEIIDLAKKSRTGATFSDLLEGRWQQYFSSQSEADLSFCNQLAFWTGRSAEMMDSIFRSSGLMREKWDRKQSGSTYGAITIKKAIRDCKQVYEPRRDSGYYIEIVHPETKDAPKPVAAQTSFSRYTLDDTGAACRMSDMFGNSLRFCFPENRFYFFDGRRWQEDNVGATQRMTDEVIDAIRDNMQAYVDAFSSNRDEDDLRKEYAKHVKKCRSNQTKNAIMKEVRSHVPILPSEMDAYPDMLNTPAGVVNLKTGEMQPHDAKLMLTKITHAEYSPSADAPLWMQFLDTTFNHDRVLIRFIQKAIGYSLTASTQEQCIFFAVGDGSNGKSTFFETLAGALGDYASNAQPDTILVRQRSQGANPDLARLRGARFVTVPEPSEGARLDEGLVKQLTGGDRITARKLYADEMEFTPEFKIWLATNHKPVIRGTDFGIWRRLCVIPFSVKIDPEKADKTLRWKLEREYAGILRWAVDGARIWHAEGLAPYPDCVQSAVNDYRTEMDVISAFASECTVPQGEASAADLYRAYVAWAREGNEYVMSATKFGRECAKRWAKCRNERGRIAYRGISLRNENIPYYISVAQ